jgi:gliding motility associated protien GldN
MKRISVIFLVVGLMTVGRLSAQQQAVKIDSTITAHDSKIEVYQKENIPFKKPIPYAPIREADVLYERTVWREIDLRQKQNYPLYYPIAPTKKIGGRVNFFTLLMEGIERGEITPYDPFPVSDEFALPITFEQIAANPSIKQEDTRETSVSIFTGNDTVIVIQGRNLLNDENIQRIKVKEKYIFDKKHSTLIRQVIGICPVFMYLRPGTDEPVPIPVCWIYMPEARPLLSRHAVFNDFNEAQNVSYDDFFMQNRYSGRIMKVANMYNNRSISEYASGVDALYESQRIEQEIFDQEQDLWEY